MMTSIARLFPWGGPVVIFSFKLVTLAFYLLILRWLGIIRREKLREFLAWWKRDSKEAD